MSGGDNPSGGGRTLGGDPAEPLPADWAQRPTQPRVGRIGDWSSSSGGTSEGRGSSGRLPSSPNDDDDDEDQDKGTESWFAGGERSGISIENPDARRSIPGGNMVRDLLRRAAQGGSAPAASAPSSSVFRGGGHTLGSEDVESTFIPDPNARDSAGAPAVRRLTLWKNGFQVEDGELMSYDNPQHAQTLAEINAGHAPAILNVRQGQQVDLHVDKRTHEDYVPPKGVKTFSGSGQRLGGVVPGVESSSGMPGSFPASSSSASAAPSSSDADKPSFATKFEVDQTAPTTSIQIRLADGTRMVARMNLTHTVGDIRSFINASRPENLTRAYSIGTTFPNRTLDDNGATIQGANLVNSVIVQRWV
ncbi:ubiquitin-related domain-containing protein [Crepidotus variabilis]|uniref:Ubiquitin-related domain-containing protein n=1 Tax=Crepidotus variabilis TaxID=179855 RepID=A0A9P6JQW1_9AGAR|nr:ubiquitin-related domain-containing protein [Crepidotus variabilis]